MKKGFDWVCNNSTKHIPLLKLIILVTAQSNKPFKKRSMYLLITKEENHIKVQGTNIIK